MKGDGTRPSGSGDRDARAQSETVGTVLFLAVTILLVAMVSVPVLSAFDADDGPAVRVSVDVGPDRVAVAHAGGDAVAVEAVDVVLSTDSGDNPVGLAAFDGLASGDSWDPGERGSRPHGADGVLRVTVVHEPTGTLLVDVRRDVPD